MATRPPTPVRTPRPLAVYYGWPSGAFSETDPSAEPAELFSRFLVVVLGAGLADPEHPDHRNTVALIQSLTAKGIEVYGYVDMGITTRAGASSLSALQDELVAWQRVGVTGIFWDDVGHEYAGGLDMAAYRERVIALVSRTHAADLTVFLNVWNPEDVFGRIDGHETFVLELWPSDLILAESWLVSGDRFTNPLDWYRKAELLSAYRSRRPFRLACVATGLDHDGVEMSGRFRAAYWAAVMYGCDLFQYTNPSYSARARQDGNRVLIHSFPEAAEDDWFLGDVRILRRAESIEFRRLTRYGEIIVTMNGAGMGSGAFQTRGSGS